MAILEIDNENPTKTPVIDLSEAADGRFFYDKPKPLKMLDLTNLQARILARTGTIHSVEGTPPGMVAKLEEEAKTLETIIKAQQGWLVVAIDNTFRVSERTQEVIEDYTMETFDDVRVLFLPAERITAQQVNPQIYGSGHDIIPVLNIRVQTESDVANADYIKSGRWLQFAIADAPMALLTEAESL